ncbi:DUF960 family protein [Cytobacillus gottheilii]|uniref:DUF960 family protein n=1 Tax=Cytobacillus gottheilii TaxID=859144 RepID=UPI000834F841|nr:DUF960 family protein [Cytobacillus gottheilii]
MFEPKQVYITKGVQESVKPEIITGMMDSIMEFKKNIVVDYLQVFDIAVSQNGKTTYVEHSQEEPPCRKQLMISNISNKFVGQIFIIDDGNCITVMLAEEY